MSSKDFWKWTTKVALVELMAIGGSAWADIPSGIIVGVNNSGGGYAAQVFYPSGAISEISDATSATQLYCTGINASGLSLIGGFNGPNGVAIYVAPDGTGTPLDVTGSGGIAALAINASGNGLLAGSDTMGNYYAAQVTPEGTVNVLSLAMGTYGQTAAALNDSGLGLLGGIAPGGEALQLYVAYISAGGTVTPLTGLPSGFGGSTLNAVAINASGNGIIGGYTINAGGHNVAYAAFVSSGSSSPTMVLDVPSGLNTGIYGVAINTSGAALMGGHDSSNNIYAASITSGGDVTPLITSPSSGAIISVALNDLGEGIIGGYNEGSNFYAAYVQSDGTLIPVFGEAIPGSINWVSISPQGVGLIGGNTNTSVGYAALVAPNGALTPLTLTDVNDITAVALANAIPSNNPVVNAVVPTSAGAYGSGVYTHLAATSALQTRFVQQNRIWKQQPTASNGIAWNELTAANDTVAVGPDSKERVFMDPSAQSRPNSIWVAPFVDFVHLKSQGSLPAYRNEVGGVLVGYDRQKKNFMVGGLLGYAFNYAKVSEGLGHGKIQEEMACVYGAYYRDHFWLDLAFWGGVYQFWNTRHAGFGITARSMTQGWLFDPHLELATPWAIGQSKRYFVEPFAMVDWVNNWLGSYREKGASGFNLDMPSHYSSLLQSEAGLRFYEKFVYGWGDFCLEEKLSYVNMAPFHFNSVTTSFVGSVSSFPIAVGSSRVQNLGSAQITAFFVPANKGYPYGGIELEVTGNSTFQSYLGSVYIGGNF